MKKETIGANILIALIFAFYVSPLIFFPDSARILKMDNLDGNIAMFKYMADNQINFMPYDKMVHGIMGDMSRLFYPSGWSFMRVLFVFFDDYTAYAIHFIFQHSVAFFGMLYLLRVLFGNRFPTAVKLTSLSFALLPFFPSGELTVAGLPLLAAALIRIFNRESRLWHWILIALFPYFSALSFGNLFIMPVLFVLFLVGIIIGWWKATVPSFMAFLLLLVTTIHVEWPLIDIIIKGIPTNRNDPMAFQTILNAKGVFGVSLMLFFKGHYHHHSLHLPVLLGLVFSSAYYFVRRVLYGRSAAEGAVKVGLILASAILFFALLQTFLQNAAFIPIKLNYRFSAMFPVLWYLLLAVLVLRILDRKIAYALLSLQIVWNVLLLNPWKTEMVENPVAYTYFGALHGDDYWHEPYDNFYMKDDFNVIKREVSDIDSSLVFCFGFHPAVAQYNGINTFDAYLNIYPREKWNLMKQINGEERLRSGSKRFSTNRCYLYSYEYEKHKKLSSPPRWGAEAMAKTGAKYILSRVDIPGLEMLFHATDIRVYVLPRQ
jgi:hypothetical protein